MKTFVLIFACLVAVKSHADAFKNLDFETPVSTNRLLNVPFPPDRVSGTGPVEDLLPWWQLTRNGVPQSLMVYNALPAGGNFFGITSRQNDFNIVELYFDLRLPQGMSGNYGVFINTDRVTYAISQRGDIPADATHLDIAAWVPKGMELETRLDGKLILGGDVGGFAGKNALLELKFFSSGVPASFEGYNIGLDYIQFVPEPSTWALVGCGAVLFAGWSWSRRYLE